MIGIFSKTTDSNLIEAAGLSGLDFIIIDLEHGAISNERLFDHIRAAKATQMKAIVRVKELNHNEIGSALDAGADGVQVPNISTVEEAKMAIEAARFHPIGKRGVCRFVKAASYGMQDKKSYFSEENKKLLILQVEGADGAKEVDKILDLDGFDILFIGPYDLSQSVGVPGDINSPKVMKLISEIAEKAKSKSKTLGTFADEPDLAKKLSEKGFQYLAYSVDIHLFASICKKTIQSIRNGK